MSRILLLLFGISATLFINTIEARSARHLEAEGIVGGDDAFEGDYPYQIVLKVLGQNICGGSILSERFVITAAHCVINEDGSFMGYPIKVVGGVSNLKKKSDHRVTVDVVKVFVPEEYDPTGLYTRETGDIALLKLKEDLDLNNNPNLGKVKLPMAELTYTGKKAIITGFGLNKIDLVRDPLSGNYEEVNGRSYKIMRYAKANVMSNKQCQLHYSDVIDEKHLCAAVVQRDFKNPEGVCSGDSGGPLVYNGAQIGVVSTSPMGCRENRAPAVYTRVSKFIGFIKKVISGKIDEEIRWTTLKVGA